VEKAPGCRLESSGRFSFTFLKINYYRLKFYYLNFLKFHYRHNKKVFAAVKSPPKNLAPGLLGLNRPCLD